MFPYTSSEVGIPIIIHGRWRAWQLIAGWKTLYGQQDISWGETVGIECVLCHLINSHPTGGHFTVYGDNQGVVEGWQNGRSWNDPVNQVFRQLHVRICTYHVIISCEYCIIGQEYWGQPIVVKSCSYDIMYSHDIATWTVYLVNVWWRRNPHWFDPIHLVSPRVIYCLAGQASDSAVIIKPDIQNLNTNWYPPVAQSAHCSHQQWQRRCWEEVEGWPHLPEQTSSSS